MGVFDGVHRGHASVLSTVREAAEATGVDALALTFDPHPRQVLTGTGPELLMSLDHRLVLLGRSGLAGVVVLPFNQEVASWTPEAFVERVLVQGLGASLVFVGKNHRFGADRRGDFALLQRLGSLHGFQARELELKREDQVISSTAIRAALAAGDLERASTLLGRPVSVLGEVVEGDRRGRTLGFPTANLNLHHAARPPGGVYVAQARTLDPDGTEGPLLPAVVNIGRRPTFNPEGEHDLVEVHLLEGGRDLYGVRLEVVFRQKLREERRFEGPDDLVAQIERDVSEARRALAD